MAKLTISSIGRFVEGFQGQRFSVGIDVHKRSFSVALLRPDGMVKSWTTPADVEAITNRLASLPIYISAVCYEAGPTGFGLARSLRSAGIKVIVAAPSRIPRPVAATNKTDSLDCIKLTELAASKLVRSIAIPTEKEEAFRALSRRRHQITDSLRRVKQRIRSLFLALGIAEPAGIDSWSKSAISALEHQSLPAGAAETRDSLLSELRYLILAQKEVDTKLERLTLEQDEAKRIAAMRSVPGVGRVVATTFAAEIYNPKRFNHSKEITSYLGLAPVIRQSGGSKGRATLRPVGQRRLRSLLIEAAWMWKQRDGWAREFYNRILGKHGVPQKAIAALARKLAALLWKLSLPAETA
ncbi:IS110 family transposase [Desulfovibrio sp. JC022]|uniref:IS110 family transposase n=1 Tax=Desulfovibrio sp. JC022 TaxID=2593642 RepID=UPI0013D256E8|nr:IS110 family transposase [Desulfovibrio sp. JC022]NDV23479.1 IS110 family transposase [Desulfovibrio sp. JC022]